MKISVVIPVYNAEKYIGRCIDSVLNQSYHNLDIIIINDGSTDISGEICEDYAKKDMRITVVHQINAGVSSARNVGIENAKGEYICFIDSDDWVESTYIEDFFYNNLNEVDLCIQGYVVDYESKKPSRNVKFLKSEVCFGKDIYRVFKYAEINYINNSPCWKLFKVGIIKENDLLFDENISYGEDHLFVLNYFLYVNSVRSVLKEGYHYEQKVSDSLTTVYVNDDKLYYYGLNSYELRRKNILKFKIIDQWFDDYVEKQLAIHVFDAIASMYHPNALINKENRETKIIEYKDIIDNLQLVKKTFNDMYFYKYMNIILSDCKYKDLLLKLLITFRKFAVRFKTH